MTEMAVRWMGWTCPALVVALVLGCGGESPGPTSVAPSPAPASSAPPAPPTVEGRSTAPATGPVTAPVPFLARPFGRDVEYRTSNFFDHDIPQEFVDNNGTYVSYWGEASLVGVDGHSGYDWQMAEGTPILAAAAGTVVLADLNRPAFHCPLLNQTVSNSVVRIEHELPGGVRVRTSYSHVSRIDVTPGQRVTQGQPIAIAGNRGCSLQSHLHFEVERHTQLQPGVDGAPIDPYGWEGAGPDPWAQHPRGGASFAMWLPNEAPELFRHIRLSPGQTPGAFVLISEVRIQGVRDAQNPNNEYVEVVRDERTAPPVADLGGFTLRNRAGTTVYTFPAGVQLTAANPSVRVFSGAGTATSKTLYIGAVSGVWDNTRECARLFNPAGAVRNQASWGGGCN